MIVFDDGLRDRLAANLEAHELHAEPLEGRRHAAVAVVVVDSVAGDDRWEVAETDAPYDDENGPMANTAGGAAFLLTRRPSRMGRHAGQWALPGGRIDEGEDPLGAALREVHEEVGLELDRSAYVGRLDDYATRSGFVITPLVLWGGAAPELAPSPHEVASLHRVRLGELQRPDSPRFIDIPESDRPVVQLPIGGVLIHAPTGAVLLQFRRVALEGISERVHHLEQPVFAWK